MKLLEAELMISDELIFTLSRILMPLKIDDTFTNVVTYVVEMSIVLFIIIP